VKGAGHLRPVPLDWRVLKLRSAQTNLERLSLQSRIRISTAQPALPRATDKFPSRSLYLAVLKQLKPANQEVLAFKLQELL
jgi:hypothetical protein